MDVTLLTNFRAMQLALIGAGAVNSLKVDRHTLNELYRIPVGDQLEIIEVSLTKDVVLVQVTETEIQDYIPINNLSDEIVQELVGMMRLSALEATDYEPLINASTGAISKSSWRL